MAEMEGTLRPRLALLKEIGADRFDPARFCYIESLTRRAIGKRSPVCLLIERKAFEALDKYQASYDQARSEAADIVECISLDYPDSADRIHQLFQEGDFRGVRRLSERLHRSGNQRVLVTLIKQIARGGTLGEDKVEPSFDDLLRRQEDEAVQSLGNSLASESSTRSSAKMELRSFHLFKETWAKLYSDRLVTRAIKEHPENPGRLNSQMLVTRSLSAMRNLSPCYLKRFVSYFETLLWLERAGENIGSRTAKKSNQSK